MRIGDRFQTSRKQRAASSPLLPQTRQPSFRKTIRGWKKRRVAALSFWIVLVQRVLLDELSKRDHGLRRLNLLARFCRALISQKS